MCRVDSAALPEPALVQEKWNVSLKTGNEVLSAPTEVLLVAFRDN